MRRSAWILLQILGFGTLLGGLLFGLRGIGRFDWTVAVAAESPAVFHAGELDGAALEVGLRPLSIVPSRDLQVAHNASGTFLGVRDDLLVYPILEGHPIRVKLNRGGSSISFRVDFDTGARAAFKPDQTNMQTVPRYEVAAYRLNRLLGLNRVAPAVPKTLSYDELLADLVPDSNSFLPRIDAEVLRT